jgi:hypothetical protein
MANNEKDKDKKSIDNISFEKEPLKYCQAAYDEAKSHNAKFSNAVAVNRAFYDGHDEVLKKRSQDPDIARSSLFIHESRTAIDTRESSFTDRLEEDELAVGLGLEGDPTPEEYDLVEDLRKELNKQMKPFFDNTLHQLFMGGEMMPYSVAKIGFEDVYEWKGFESKFTKLTKKPKRFIKNLLSGQEIPKDKTQWKWVKTESRPYINWLDWDEFYHDPKATSLDVDHCSYVIHVAELSWEQLNKIAIEREWDKSKMDRVKTEPGHGDQPAESMADKVRSKEEVDTNADNEDAYTLAEFMIPVRSDTNELKIHTVYVVNNKHLMANEPSDLKALWGQYPYVIRWAYKKLGHFEGLSTIDLCKDSQRAYSDTFNALFDGLTYGNFRPLMNKRGNVWYGDVKYAPGARFDVDDPDGVQPLPDTLGDFSFIPLVIQSLEAKIRQITNAPDFDQTVQNVNDQEKATKTRLRAQGSIRRLRRLFSEIRQIIIDIAWMYIKLNQQEDSRWMMDFKVTVPVLSGAFTADEEFNKALLIYREAKENPLYNSPDGLLKLRELWIDVLNAARIKDIDSRVLKKEDFEDQAKLADYINKKVEEALPQTRE